MNPWAQLDFRVASLEELVKASPERISKLFSGLNLDHPGLWKVKAGATGGDYAGACRALVEYYRSQSLFPELRSPIADSADLAAARQIMVDTFTFQQLTGRQPRRPGGGLDWDDEGPSGDTEWAYLLNRHEWFATLLGAYHFTGDERYARRLNELITDWIVSNPLPVGEDCCPQWRPLEAALRFRTWPAVFYGLQASDSFTDAARLLMLISIMEHGSFIQRYHWTHQNHALFQLNGLARLATFWPEFRDAGAWFDYAARHMLYEMEGQVLPDGVQDELTSLYHYHSILQFQEVMDLAGPAGKELPPAFRSGLEKMYDYLAYTQRPDGYSLLNNDSDRNDYRGDLARAAAAFNRSDWDFIISNGRSGQAPAKQSVLFPWAGQVIMRDGWEPAALWSFFDAGPDGTAHRHYDKLHLSVAAGGRDLLVDSGRFWYKSDIWREYFVSSYGHNLILVDGFGHRPDVNRYDTDDEVAFETNDRYSYAQATFDAGFREVEEPVMHTRGLLFLPGHFWIVIDRLRAEEEHAFQPLWHFHPDCRVVTRGSLVYSNDPGVANLLIRPAGDRLRPPELHFGPDSLDHPETYRQWKPRALGEFPVFSSYSPAYNQKEPGGVAVYHGSFTGESTVVWLLLPFEGSDPPENVRIRKQAKGPVLQLKARAGDHRLRASVDLEKGRVLKFSLKE